MWNTELRGIKLQGTEIIKIEKQELETIFFDGGRKFAGPYEFVQIETSRGRVDCAYYRAEGADNGVIMVGVVKGDFDSPTDSLYPRLSADINEKGISALR